MNDFALSPPQLQLVQGDLARQITLGLKRNGERVLALPTFLPPLARRVSGEAYVIDLGGSNIRGARISFDEATEATELTWGNRSELPLVMTSDEFVDAHAHALDPVRCQRALPLAYCFSYPARSQEDGDAVVLKLTKGVDFQGLVGKPIGQFLGQGLRDAGIETTRVTVVNDTVASLFAIESVNPGAENLGLIVGTGTNAAAFFSPDNAPKLSFPQAINLESGNAHLPFTTAVDEAVDAASENPGQQSFEKAVSGRYLPRLFAEATGLPDHPAALSTKALRVLSLTPGAEHSHIAQALFERSARLVGAKIAALASVKRTQKLKVLAEGGLIWSHESFGSEVTAVAAELGVRAEVVRVDGANIKGAAAAALAFS